MARAFFPRKTVQVSYQSRLFDCIKQAINEYVFVQGNGRSRYCGKPCGISGNRENSKNPGLLGADQLVSYATPADFAREHRVRKVCQIDKRHEKRK